MIQEFKDAYQRYRHVESELAQQQLRLRAKEPEIRKCLDAVNLLKQKNETADEENVRNLPFSDEAPGTFVCIETMADA